MLKAAPYMLVRAGGPQFSNRLAWYLVLLLIGLVLAGCGTPKKAVSRKPSTPHQPLSIKAEGARKEVVLYALGLLDVGYQFGGKNPEAGVDCSGMVAFIYKNAVGVTLPHNAAAIAKLARSIAHNDLQAGDLVFFNTTGRAYSHVGVYLGDDKFIHAPATRGKVRIESLSSPYFAARYIAAGTLLE